MLVCEEGEGEGEGKGGLDLVVSLFDVSVTRDGDGDGGGDERGSGGWCLGRKYAGWGEIGWRMWRGREREAERKAECIGILPSYD